MSKTDTPLLELRELSKHFRSYWAFRPIQAVKGVSLSIGEGESFGFLGHNGAGKTTTIKSIVGLLRPSAGEILFRGASLTESAQREHIGYLPEQPYFYDHLSVWETMEFFASLYGINAAERKAAIERALSLVHLTTRNKSSVRALSKGLQQRLALAQAILNKPKLLLLDEPFSGLDPIGRKEVRDLILALRAEGTTIFLSSHILSDVKDICDRVAIMLSGELKLEFPLAEIATRFGQGFELVLAADDSLELSGVTIAERKQEDTASGPLSKLQFTNYQEAQKALLIASEKGVRIVSFETKGKSLEDIFVATTQGTATDEKAEIAVEAFEQEDAGPIEDWFGCPPVEKDDGVETSDDNNSLEARV